MFKLKNPYKEKMAYTLIIILIIFSLLHIEDIYAVASRSITILKPFILGFCIAFILNLPIKVLERKVFKFSKSKKKPAEILKVKRGLSIVTTLLILTISILLLTNFIVPQLKESMKILIDSIPGYLSKIEETAKPIINSIEIVPTIKQNIINAWDDIAKIATQFTTVALNGIMATTVTATNLIINTALGMVFAIYMLINKEKLCLQAKKVVFAFINKKYADRIIEIARLSNGVMGKFLAGQGIEALILGILCFIIMVILGMPYPLLISTIIGITNVLPVAGPFIGAIPATFIILMIDFKQAVWFVIFIIVLQQIESQLIYPRVVGTSIGISSLWVLLAILIGGSIAGPIGMLVGVPLMAIVYKIVSDEVNRKLKKKQLKIT